HAGRAGSGDRCTSVQISSEGCPSGQREQAVNLPASAYVGSNPTPSTPQRAANMRGAVVRYVQLAGVAQLVERQPSKLNVAGSTPVSRSDARSIRRRLVWGALGAKRSVGLRSGGSPT